MARVSFRLRYDESAGGSYNRFNYETVSQRSAVTDPVDEQIVYDQDTSLFYVYDLAKTAWVELGEDVDTALRADGYQPPPVAAPTSYFSAVASSYDEVTLEWGVSGLGTTSTNASTAQFLVIVYSDRGEPQTINSGVSIYQASSSGDRLHNPTTHPNFYPKSGKWAYYSMFVNFGGITGSYYERVASVRVLVPYNHKSTQYLYSKIPLYYRTEDYRKAEYASQEALDTLGGVSWPPEADGYKVGELYKFLSIFGFDMDRIRTILDYQMVSRDPAIADTQTLNALAYQLGVGIRSDDLGAARLRAIMDDIGYYRRSKGTLDQITGTLRALTGCRIELDQGNNTDGSGRFYVYDQRVNYITDPKCTSLNSGTRNGASWADMVNDRPAHEDEDDLASALAFSANTYNAYKDTATTTADRAYTVSGRDYTYANSATANGAGVKRIMFKLSCPIPVKLNESVVFSIHGQNNAGVKWVRLVAQDGTVLGSTNKVKTAEDVPAYQVPLTNSTVLNDTTYVRSYLEFLVDISDVETFRLQYLLAERNHIGNYFDGSEERSGWYLASVGGNTSYSSEVKDHRWRGGSGNADNAVSLYTEQFYKMTGLMKAACIGTLPITEEHIYRTSGTGAPIISFEQVDGSSLLGTAPTSSQP